MRIGFKKLNVVIKWLSIRIRVFFVSAGIGLIKGFKLFPRLFIFKKVGNGRKVGFEWLKVKADATIKTR